MSLSLDLRQRVVEALQNGQTQRAVAERFAVSLSSVERLARKQSQGQSLHAGISTGRIPQIKTEQYQAFEALVRSRTDWTLQSIATAWQEQGGRPLSIATACRTLKRIQFAFKKSAVSLPNETLKNERRSNEK